MRFLLFLLLFLPSSLFAQNSMTDAINRALKNALYDHPQWRTLLHVVRNESQIDDSRFFNDPSGKKDLKAELIATIQAFYKPLATMPPPEEISLKEISDHPYDTHAQCRFKARFEFLNEQLQFENLPNITCYEYKKMRDHINPKAITIVFPSAHISSPASMFGHTFLLFESGYKSRLLSYALNYAAAANQLTENPFIFTFKGLFGYYEGYYTISPYYDTLKEYRDTENRDVWEFQLNLDEQETMRAFNHMWELRNIYSYYYFFNENCSYNLFWILEVARPSLKLRDQFFYQVIPPETLFVMQEQNLIQKEYYRPSKRRIIKEYEKHFSYGELKKIEKKALEEALEEENFDIPKKQLFLESILELSEYYYIKAMLDKEKYTKIAHEVAYKRSKLGKGQSIKSPLVSSPLQGHRAIRLFSGMGIDSYGLQGLLEARVAYHDLSESDRGFLEGTEIEFLRLLLSYDEKSMQMQEVRIFSLSSFAPISPLFQPLSYRFLIGADRILGNRELNPNIKLGIGTSLAVSSQSFAYYLVEPLAFYTQRAYRNQKSVVGVSNTLGWVTGGQTPYKLNMEYSNTLYSNAVVENYFKGTLSVAWKNQALFLKYQLRLWNAYSQSRYSSFQAGMRFYF